MEIRITPLIVPTYKYASILPVRGRRFITGCLRLLCLGIIVINSACSTTGTVQGDRYHQPSPFARAIKDPNTWLPLATALLIAAADGDEDITQWATEHHPLYGSEKSAQDASDKIRGVLSATALATSVISPGTQDGLVHGRSGNLVTGVASAAANSQLTGILKDSTERTRPNKVDNRSLPSSHTSAASTYATLSAIRTNELDLSVGTRKALGIGYHSLAAATGWARVEANAHYATDVLTGYALGNFTSRFFYETLQGSRNPVAVGLNLNRKEGAFQFTIRFSF